jgi:long-chain fatty acid transport protein
MRRLSNVMLLAAAATILPVTAHATNGYFLAGVGTDHKAMAGAGVALPLSALSAATNPAGLAFVGDRLDLAIALFNPNRDYTVTGDPSPPTDPPHYFGLTPGEVKSDSRYFPVPSAGYSHAFGGKQALGVTFYGNGGMNTDYPAATFYGTDAGVNLSQMFLGVTYARKLDEKNAFGLTPMLAYQYFKATGLQSFAGYSSDPANLTDEGTAGSFGGGVRVGYLGRWLPQLAFGASYQSRTWMTAFDKYKGLFAGQGGFDIPSSWVVGVAVTPHPMLDFAVDVQQVRYSEIKSIANPLLPNLKPLSLGADDGPGFGWKDMTVVKGGVQVRGADGWTWRAGYSYGQQPIPESEMLFNILAPGVIQQHASVGFSKTLPGGRDLHFALTRAFSNEVTGPNPLEAPGQQDIKLRMDQWDVEVGVGFGGAK